MKTLERTIPMSDSKTYNRPIIVIGAGGTGSYVVPHIARRIASTKSNVKLIIVDGDVVEEKNLIRQNFCEADIGRYKAQVLAERYASAFGIQIVFSTKFLKDSYELKGEGKLIITCTDNIKSRAIVNDFIVSDTYDKAIWIDCGNEKVNGQVIITGSSERNNPFGKLPTPFDIFPEYIAALEEEKKVEESCAEHAAASPEQAGFINNLAATIAVNYADALMANRNILTHMTKFNISNVFESVPITESVCKLRSGKRVL